MTIGLLALLVAPNIGVDEIQGVEKLLIVRGLRLLRLVRALRTCKRFFGYFGCLSFHFVRIIFVHV